MSDVKDYPPYLDHPKPRQSMTNADRIRGMSDEELAAFIMADLPCDALYGQMCTIYHGNCEGCVRDWLRQPAEKA